eukprot:403358216
MIIIMNLQTFLMLKCSKIKFTHYSCHDGQDLLYLKKQLEQFQKRHNLITLMEDQMDSLIGDQELKIQGITIEQTTNLKFTKLYLDGTKFIIQAIDDFSSNTMVQTINLIVDMTDYYENYFFDFKVKQLLGTFCLVLAFNSDANAYLSTIQFRENEFEYPLYWEYTMGVLLTYNTIENSQGYIIGGAVRFRNYESTDYKQKAFIYSLVRNDQKPISQDIYQIEFPSAKNQQEFQIQDYPMVMTYSLIYDLPDQPIYVTLPTISDENECTDLKKIVRFKNSSFNDLLITSNDNNIVTIQTVFFLEYIQDRTVELIMSIWIDVMGQFLLHQNLEILTYNTKLEIQQRRNN